MAGVLGERIESGRPIPRKLCSSERREDEDVKAGSIDSNEED